MDIQPPFLFPELSHSSCPASAAQSSSSPDFQWSLLLFPSPLCFSGRQWHAERALASSKTDSRPGQLAKGMAKLFLYSGLHSYLSNDL